MTVFQPQTDDGSPALSPREREVLDLIARGSTNREIAAALHLSPHTIHEHTSSLYRKLDVRNRAEAVQRAARLGPDRLSTPQSGGLTPPERGVMRAGAALHVPGIGRDDVSRARRATAQRCCSPARGSRSPIAREHVERVLPELLARAGELIGEDCFERAGESTRFAQPAIFLSSLAAFATLEAARPTRSPSPATRSASCRRSRRRARCASRTRSSWSCCAGG